MASQLTSSPASATAQSALASELLPQAAPNNEEHLSQELAWQEARRAWLLAKQGRSGSPHTARAYEHDWNQFFQFVHRKPWDVTSRDANAWLHHLRKTGVAESSISRKLAAMSSFYQFVIDQCTGANPNKRVRALYLDAHGCARPNPFRKSERPQILPYSQSQPIAIDTLRQVLKQINQATRLGSRDFALLVAYIYTGRRSSEIAGLRWGHIDADRADGRYYYEWSGGRDKRRRDELPPPVYHAIVNFLAVNGRLERIQPQDYIFQPVYGERAQRLPNVHDIPEENRPISGSMINRIVKRCLAAAGVPAAAVHTFTLRHTAAYLRHQNGNGQDVAAISRLLDHSSVAITEVYLNRMQQPIDSGWSAIEEQLTV